MVFLPVFFPGPFGASFSILRFKAALASGGGLNTLGRLEGVDIDVVGVLGPHAPFAVVGAGALDVVGAGLFELGLFDDRGTQTGATFVVALWKRRRVVEVNLLEILSCFSSLYHAPGAPQPRYCPLKAPLPVARTL